MISRKLAWFLGAAFVGTLVVAHWAGGYPARVVLINQGTTVQNVKVVAAGDSHELGAMQSGETRVVKIESGDYVTVEYDASRHRRWQSPDKIAPAQSLILNLRDDHVEIQQRQVVR